MNCEVRCQLLYVGSALLSSCIGCDFDDEHALQLSLNTSLQQLDIRIESNEDMEGGVEPLDLTNFQYNGEAYDGYPSFLRTWQHILRTIPSTVWQKNESFRLNVTAMSWSALTKDYSRPVIRTLRLLELTNLMGALFRCHHSVPRGLADAGEDIVDTLRACRFIVMNAADYWDHLMAHTTITNPEIRLRPISWGVVQCKFDDELLLATPPAIARHYGVHHPVYCPVHLLSESPSPLDNAEIVDLLRAIALHHQGPIPGSCGALLEPSPMAFVKHFHAWHCYRNDSIALNDQSLPDLRQMARKALEDQLRPSYSLHERVAKLRASAAPIEDELEVTALSRDEIKARLEQLSYYDTGTSPATYLETMSDVSAQQELARGIMRAQQMYSTPDFYSLPAYDADFITQLVGSVRLE